MLQTHYEECDRKNEVFAGIIDHAALNANKTKLHDGHYKTMAFL